MPRAASATAATNCFPGTPRHDPLGVADDADRADGVAGVVEDR